MANQVELYFMNSLPQSYRKAAEKLYIQPELDELFEMRLKGIEIPLLNQFALSKEAKIKILNAVLLTRLSQLSVGPHLSKTNLLRLAEFVPQLLDMADGSNESVMEFLQENAVVFAQWYELLLKSIPVSKN